MLISKDFVFLHVQKTGGNFVRHVFSLLEPKFLGGVVKAILLFIGKDKRTLLRRYYFKNKIFNSMSRHPLRSQGYHESCRTIPEMDRDKLIVSIKRDPLPYYVSCYLYGKSSAPDVSIYKWREYYQRNRGDTDPDFGEFLRFYVGDLPRLLFLEWTGKHMPSTVGFMTFNYIWFFFGDPVEVLLKPEEEIVEYFRTQRHKKNMHQVHFLRTEQLNKDLYDFLSGLNFPPKKLRFILGEKKRNVSEVADDESFWNQELVDYVKERDEIYYRYFYKPANPSPPPPPGSRRRDQMRSINPIDADLLDPSARQGADEFWVVRTLK